jgi:transposase
MDKQQDGKGFDPLTVTSNGRRYFVAEHKREVVERRLQPGASTAAVALEYGFNANLVRKWVRRHQARQLSAATALLPVSIVDAPPSGRRAAAKRRGNAEGQAKPCARSLCQKPPDFHFGETAPSKGVNVKAACVPQRCPRTSPPLGPPGAVHILTSPCPGRSSQAPRAAEGSLHTLPPRADHRYVPMSHAIFERKRSIWCAVANLPHGSKLSCVAFGFVCAFGVGVHQEWSRWIMIGIRSLSSCLASIAIQFRAAIAVGFLVDCTTPVVRRSTERDPGSGPSDLLLWDDAPGRMTRNGLGSMEIGAGETRVDE